MQTNHAQDNTTFQGKRAAIFVRLKSATRVVAEVQNESGSHNTRRMHISIKTSTQMPL